MAPPVGGQAQGTANKTSSVMGNTDRWNQFKKAAAGATTPFPGTAAAQAESQDTPWNQYTAPPQAYSTGGGLGQGVSFDEQQKADAQRSAYERAQGVAQRHPGGFLRTEAATGHAAPVNVSGIMKGYANPTAPNPNSNMGLDFSRQGAAEQFYEDNKHSFTAPTQASKVSDAAMSQMMGPGAAEGYAAQVSARYPNGMPQLDADMGKYYDNAKRRAAESIDQQMAARGLYSSSAATDRIGEAFTDLEADRAKAEADYGLKRSQAELGWTTGLSGIMEGSDAARNSRFGTMGGLASEADATRLGGLSAGMGAAGAAQDAQRTRGQDFFNREMMLSSIMGDMAGGAYEGMFNADQAMLDSISALLAGNATDAFNTNDKYRNDKAQGLAAAEGGAVEGLKAYATMGASLADQEEEDKKRT